MDTSVFKNPQPKARAAGFFWLTTFVIGLLSMIAYDRIIVAGNAAATAANIVGQKTLFQLSIAANLVSTLAYIAVVALIYELFKPAGRTIALLGACFGLVGCAIGGFSGAFQIAPMVILESAQNQQLQELAFLFVRVGTKAAGIAFPFFALHCLLTGVLVLKSAYVPRLVGALMVLAGIGWLTFLWPPLAVALQPYNILPGMLGEGALTLWLLVKGVNAERWWEQAGAHSSTVHATA
jgi:hypothetical protein